MAGRCCLADSAAQTHPRIFSCVPVCESRGTEEGSGEREREEGAAAQLANCHWRHPRGETRDRSLSSSRAAAVDLHTLPGVSRCPSPREVEHWSWRSISNHVVGNHAVSVTCALRELRATP